MLANEATEQEHNSVWVKVKNHPPCYIANKLISVCITIALATYTLSLTAEFAETANGFKCGGYTYKLIFWLLFLFYSFQGLDELIEMYAVLAGREKGAIGLIFELNYFLGMGLAFYILAAVNAADETCIA